MSSEGLGTGASTPTSTNRFKPANSTDVGWDYGQPVDGNIQHISCDFCGHISRGGIKRFKHHLLKASSKNSKFKDVRACDKVPKEVVEIVKKYVDEKEKTNQEREKSKNDMLNTVNVYGDDDEVEEIGSNNRPLPKKRKGPMDAFVAPIDVNFVPKAPSTNSNKKALENCQDYIAEFFYDNDIPFYAAKSDSYLKMFRAVVQYNDPSTFKPPSYHDLRIKLLKKKKEEIGNWVKEFKIHWDTFGCTLMTDWWTDGKGRTLINFLVNCPKGTIFLKSIDGSSYMHTGERIQGMLEEVIEEIGVNNVIQMCTDNASNYKLAGRWLEEKEGSKLYWMPCAAHCINLMLGDVGKLPLVNQTVQEAQKISIFIYNHKHVLHLMRNETKGREIVRPAVTRFATTFLCLQSMYEKRQHLRDMIHTNEWRASKWPKNKIAKGIVLKIKSCTFWNNIHTCLKIMAPIVDVLRMVDCEEKPAMGYIYSAMDLCKAKIKANIGDATLDDRTLWKKMERIVDSRWNDLLSKPLHCAGHYLNPQNYYASVEASAVIENNSVIKEGLLTCIEKLAGSEEVETQILKELAVYRTRGGRLGKRNAMNCLKELGPVEWWQTFGSEFPALQRIAVRILGLTCSASPCERNWSTFSNIHTKKRNCLDHARLESLAYIQYNRRLKKRYEERISLKPIDPIELKSLDECVEWLVFDDARNDTVLGMDGLTYGNLEDAEDGSNDPPTTRSRNNSTNARARVGSSSSQPLLEESSEEDDYDDTNLDEDDHRDEDGLDLGTDEDI